MSDSSNFAGQAPEVTPKFYRRRFFVLSAAFLLVAFFVFLVTACWGSWRIWQPVDRQDINTEEFSVLSGMGVKEIAQELAERNFIRSPFWFEVYIWVNRKEADLQAGEYALSRSFNAAQTVEMFTGGEVILNETQLTFPEGFEAKQIEKRLLEGGLVSADGLSKAVVADFQVQYKFLTDVPSGAGLEGFLFPDTYRFKKDLEKGEIIKKFLDNLDKKLAPDLREEISRQGRPIYDVIILASIVQQESKSEEEMPQIAGVFAKRLQIGMALESDATINFITGKQDRQPLYGDLKIKSPYNTYLNRGLPPGPICNPGLAAIKAAISPQIGDYLYFLHPLNGPAVFSKTLDEHNRNKEKWLK